MKDNDERRRNIASSLNSKKDISKDFELLE